MRCEPLPATDRHPIGNGPFRGRGVLFNGYLEYIARRTPGGMDAVRAAIEDPAVVAFFDQIFLATGSYDLSPLIHLVRAAARVEGTPLGDFIRERSRAAAGLDAAGVYRQQLKAASPEQAAGELEGIPRRALVVRATWTLP